MAMQFPPQVERWRPIVAKYVPPQYVDKVLWVIQHESGGNPSAIGDGGVAIGLLQIHDNTSIPGRPTKEQLLDPEFNILYAAQKLGMASGNFRAWGEGTEHYGHTYNPETGTGKFGALGFHPFPGDAAATTGDTGTKAARFGFGKSLVLPVIPGQQQQQQNKQPVSGVAAKPFGARQDVALALKTPGIKTNERFLNTVAKSISPGNQPGTPMPPARLSDGSEDSPGGSSQAPGFPEWPTSPGGGPVPQGVNDFYTAVGAMYPRWRELYIKAQLLQTMAEMDMLSVNATGDFVIANTGNVIMSLEEFQEFKDLDDRLATLSDQFESLYGQDALDKFVTRSIALYEYDPRTIAARKAAEDYARAIQLRAQAAAESGNIIADQTNRLQASRENAPGFWDAKGERKRQLANGGVYVAPPPRLRTYEEVFNQSIENLQKSLPQVPAPPPLDLSGAPPGIPFGSVMGNLLTQFGGPPPGTGTVLPTSPASTGKATLPPNWLQLIKDIPKSVTGSPAPYPTVKPVPTVTPTPYKR
jgi:hypothetical protein